MNAEIEIAKSLMKEIMYDNGAVNRLEPERYPKKWINMIAPVAGKFFDKNPDCLNDDDVNLICCGEETEVQNKFGKLEGFQELHIVLNNYFNSGM